MGGTRRTSGPTRRGCSRRNGARRRWAGRAGYCRPPGRRPGRRNGARRRWAGRARRRGGTRRGRTRRNGARRRWAGRVPTSGQATRATGTPQWSPPQVGGTSGGPGCSPSGQPAGRNGARRRWAGRNRRSDPDREVLAAMEPAAGGRDEPKADYAQLLDAAHQQLGGPLVVVWDNLNVHGSPPWSRPGSGGCSTGPASSKGSSPAPAWTSHRSVTPTVKDR